MVITNHKFDAPQAPLFQPYQEVLPTRLAFPVRKLHRQHTAPAVPIDPDPYQHGTGSDNPFFPDFLIPSIQNQVGIVFLKSPL
jgi:hypothetical protein